jgi:zinc transport system substrate-binding protein
MPASTPPASSAAPEAVPSAEPLKVVTAFYPLTYLAEQVGGDQITVTNLTPPGGEPHDLELTPQQVAAIGEADLVLYIEGFQPAVDEAVAQQASSTALSMSANLTLLEGEEHEGAHGATDPHVWLNPLNMEAMGTTVADRLSSIRADKQAVFSANAQALASTMSELDAAWAAGTEKCTSRDLVTSHEAFGYLAKRYGFTQVGISGLSPDSEPSPAKIVEIADFVRANNVKTIYYETLVDPKIAETVASETGASTAVLDPLEGLAPGSTGNYVTVMESNLASVKAGNGCA